MDVAWDAPRPSRGPEDEGKFGLEQLKQSINEEEHQTQPVEKRSLSYHPAASVAQHESSMGGALCPLLRARYPHFDEPYPQTEHVGKLARVRGRHLRRQVPLCAPPTHECSLYWPNSAIHMHDEKRLRSAASSGNVDLARQLLESGVNVRASDDKQRSGLHLAAAGGHEAMVRLLLSRGADPNQTDLIGNTPLHLATCTHHIPIITLLLKHGTDVTSLDKTGASPLKLVVSRLQRAREGKDRLASSDQFKNELSQILALMLAYEKRLAPRLQHLSLKDPGGGIGGVRAPLRPPPIDDGLDELCGRLERTTTLDEMDAIGDMLADLAQLRIDQSKLCSAMTGGVDGEIQR